MPAVQSETGLLQEIAHAIRSVGDAVRRFFAADPAPYWADYLREERRKGH